MEGAVRIFGGARVAFGAVRAASGGVRAASGGVRAAYSPPSVNALSRKRRANPEHGLPAACLPRHPLTARHPP